MRWVGPHSSSMARPWLQASRHGAPEHSRQAVALVLISLFIATLPRVLALIGRLWPEVDDHHGIDHVEVDEEEDLVVLAAIGFVLHTEFQRQLAGDTASKSSS